MVEIDDSGFVIQVGSLLLDSDKLAQQTIDLASRDMGFGGAGSVTYTIINGLNIIGGIPKMPVNADQQGYTFFTKPQLNLSYDNVISSRRLSAYADQRPNNGANVIRCLLQPAGFLRPLNGRAIQTVQEKQANMSMGLPHDNSVYDIRSEMVDDKCAFITMLSNTLTSLSGWPDLSPDVYTSNEGIAKEQVSWIDDRPYQNGTFDLTANFNNIEGDMLTHLFHCWIEYACRVAEGSMMPFPINVITNRVDYQTRIYRITLDRSRQYLQGIASTIAFPTALPIGRAFDFNLTEKLSLEANQVSIPFRCIGVEYNDPILIREFNRLVERFNPDMKADFLDNRVREDRVNNRRWKRECNIPNPDKMVEITEMEKQLYNYKCYPFIADTNEFLWFTPIDVYNEVHELRNKGPQI